MRLFDKRLMKLLTFLTRKQGWLSPLEISKSFTLDGRRVGVRTLHRWLSFLREEGGLVYYPYPKANKLGLQDVLVRIYGLRIPEMLSILPFGSSFSVEVSLVDCVPFVSQGYWVPGSAITEFEEFWRAARDKGLLERFEVFWTRNTHFIFSPFHMVTREDGKAELAGSVDNGHFEALIRRNLREGFEVKVAGKIADSPLLIPIVVEHIWEHFSSRQVWRAIRAKGVDYLRAYTKGRFSKALERPGSALRLLQQQWRTLLENFDEVFLQPRVFFDWPSLTNSTFLTLLMRGRPLKEGVKAAIHASERSIVTSLKPGIGAEGKSQISCFLPTDQILPILRLARRYHRGPEPLTLSIQDREATLELFQPAFCKLDWRLFDPNDLSWRFDFDGYLERLGNLKTDT